MAVGIRVTSFIVALRRRILSGDATSQLVWILIPLALMIALLVLQYSKYGVQRFLGWDSVNYVYLATLITQFGPATMIAEWNYPHIYVLSLWALGSAFGNIGLVERWFPLLWLLVLFFGYAKVSWGLHRAIAPLALTMVLSGVTVTVMRVFADLNRTLMAYSLSLITLYLLSREHSPAFKISRGKLLIIGLLLLVAATELETYFILLLAIIFASLYQRDFRRTVEAASMGLFPLLVLSPLLIGFLLAYPAAIEVLPSLGTRLDPLEAVLFGAGSVVTLPFVLLGTYAVFRLAGRNNMARMLAGWMLALGVAFGLLITEIVALPPIRVLYLVPIPVLLVASIYWLDRLAQSWSARVEERQGAS